MATLATCLDGSKVWSTHPRLPPFPLLARSRPLSLLLLDANTRRYGKGKSTAGNVARGHKKTRFREEDHGGKAVKKNIMPMKSMKFMKSVKKKILKFWAKAEHNGNGKPTTGNMAKRRNKTQAHQ